MTPPKRHQSQTERDLQGFAARKEREAAPVEVEPEITENYDGEELAEKRATRPPLERISRLERKQDADRKAHHELVESVHEWRHETTEEFGNVKASIGELTGAVKGLTMVIDAAAKREHVTFTARVDVDKAREIDTIDARKSKRDLVLKLASGAIALITSGAFLGWWLS